MQEFFCRTPFQGNSHCRNCVKLFLRTKLQLLKVTTSVIISTGIERQFIVYLFAYSARGKKKGIWKRMSRTTFFTHLNYIFSHRGLQDFLVCTILGLKSTEAEYSFCKEYGRLVLKKKEVQHNKLQGYQLSQARNLWLVLVKLKV